MLQTILIGRVDTTQWDPAWLWTAPIVDASTAATLTLGFLGLLGIRRQFQIGLRPLITYDRLTVTASTRHVASIDDHDAIVVTLTNTGLGPAVITNVRYNLRLADSGVVFESAVAQELREFLSTVGMHDRDDYVVTAFGRGATIGRDSTRLVGEFPSPFLRRVEDLVLTIDFQGLLGDRYTKRIECVPPGQKPRHREHPTRRASADGQ